MSEFQPIAPRHRDWFRRAGELESSESSSGSFGNVFLWDILCRRNVAMLGERLGVEFLCPRGIFYAYPQGGGSLAAAVEALRKQAEERGVSLCLHGVTRAQRQRLEETLPGRFDFVEDRDNFDYIYSLESFATLAGKKLHGKRNFCNRFESAHDWRFAALEPALFDGCLEVLSTWDAERDGGSREENRAIRRAFEYWDDLDFMGGVLCAEGRPVAFTMGEIITPDTMNVHFEKARSDVPGAYPMVAREFARLVRERRPEILWLNREEDMGRPNLRRAKEEWYPARLLEKYTARWRDAP